jgi:hypothetical protein
MDAVDPTKAQGLFNSIKVIENPLINGSSPLYFDPTARFCRCMVSQPFPELASVGGNSNITHPSLPDDISI